MSWIIRSSMRLQFLVVVVAVALMAFGIVQLHDMPVDVYPEFDPPLVEVQTEALGLAADEVESLITTPLEADMLNGVAWLDQIYSESVTGLSRILLVFEPGTDPIRARQMVQERLTQAFALPNVSKPPAMLQPLSSTNRVLMVGLTSDDVSPIDMSVLAHWTVQPRLLGVPGVANVAVWGQRDWQLQVQVDPTRLHDAGVTLRQVIETTGNAMWASPLSYLEASTPGTAGWIDTPNQRLTLQHQSPISSAEDLSRMALVGSEGLVLGDVTDVVEDHQPLIGDAVLGDGPGLLLVIEKFPGANTLEVTRGVEEALNAMQAGLTGIEIDTTVFRPADYIEQAASNLSTLLLIGGVLVALVLVAFFFDLGAAFVSLVAISVSLLAAVLVLYVRGASFNMMILAGLVVALVGVVDDAIIDVENIVRRLRQRREEDRDKSPASIILGASFEMRGPIVFALLIIALTVLPVFLLEGESGAFFQPLAVSYLLAVLTSLAVALIVTPALSLTLLSNALLMGRKSPLARMLQGGYSAILARSVRAPRLALVITAVLILIGLAALSGLDLSLLPSLKEQNLQIQWASAPGTSHPAMVQTLTTVCGELRSISGVRNCNFHVGRAITGDQVVNINSGELWLNLDSKADYDATVSAIQAVADSYPGQFIQVGNYEPERLREVLTEADHEMVVRVYGNDYEILHAKADEARQRISEVNGVVDAQVEPQVKEEQIQIEVNLDKAERHRVKPGDVRRQVTTLLSGLTVGNLYEKQKVFDVVVWGVPEIRSSLADVRALPIETPGGLVPLEELAVVRVALAPTIIRHDAVSRFVDVGVKVSGRDIASVTADVQRRLQEIEFPLEYNAVVLEESVAWQSAQQRVLGVAAIAVVGIFMLLQAAFGSWSLAAVAILTLPTALTGGVLAALLSGGALSLGSVFGFLAVLAIAVRNGIVMTVHFQHLQQHEGESFGPALVLRGARERLAPILMTTLTTVLALLPMVLVGDVAGNEIVRPMAIVIVGGLVTTAVFDLFILPAFYLRFAPSTLAVASSVDVSAKRELELVSGD